MRSTLRELLPSMFHRRLLLLTAAMLAVLFVLGVATARLASGESFLEARRIAESKLRGSQLIHTRRGSIIDRHGVVLALDEPGYDLVIHYDLLTGRWAQNQAYTDASSDKVAWGEMSQLQRDEAVERLRLEYEQQTTDMFRTLGEVSGLGLPEISRRRSQAVERVQQMQNYLWQRWQETAERERGEDVLLEEVAQPIAPETEHHVIIRDVDDNLHDVIQSFIDVGNRARETGNEEGRSALPWTMAEFQLTTVRRYPKDEITVELDRSSLPSPLASDEPVEIVVRGVGLHLIGLMRDVWAEDAAARPLRDGNGNYLLGGYTDGDRLGRSGIEQAMERHLRGSRGMRTISLDTHEEIDLIDPIAGRDVMLTVDIRLQALVQAIMSPEFGLMQTQPWHLGPDDPQELVGRPLNGAAVVIDIASGDVLAAVSMPEAPRNLLQEDPDLLWDNPINNPMINRAIASKYQPGSTMKPLVLVAAVTDAVLGQHELIDTPGFLWPNNPMVFRDWYWKHYALVRGEIDGVTAIEVSSNPFFGILAERLIARYGLDRLPNWYRSFGLGQLPGTGLPEEIRGNIGSPGRELEHNDVCFMSIGQGPVSWTPLQAAVAYARLGSGNMSLMPRMVVSPDITSPDNLSTGPGYQMSEVGRRMALEGMRRSAGTTQGTTHHLSHPDVRGETIFNVDGVTIMAKSGTADPGPARWIDFNNDGQVDDGEIERSPRDHAWVIALVQPDGAASPTHVVVCVTEYAGSGGQVSGPVVNQIIHALQREQYLEWPSAR